MDAEQPQGAASFVVEVGRRLRTIRRQQKLSLEDVERRSGGRWSASAIGAYERGYRNLSLSRLRELADFYGVPISVLVGEIDLRAAAPGAVPRLVLDLVALERQSGPAAQAVARYARSIAMERGDFNGRVISLRRDDLRVLAAVLAMDEAAFSEQLRQWGVLGATAPGGDGQQAPSPSTIDLTSA
jgi:transcriptional regulator with XRE-family HTH domain